MNAARLFNGSILSDALARGAVYQVQLTEAARQHAAERRADDIALLLDLDRAQVWDALCNVPDNMLTLLESPHGWTALAGYVGQDFGRVERPTRQPFTSDTTLGEIECLIRMQAGQI